MAYLRLGGRPLTGRPPSNTDEASGVLPLQGGANAFYGRFMFLLEDAPKGTCSGGQGAVV